jgi:hypothetical protein
MTTFAMKYCVLGQKKLFNNFIRQFDWDYAGRQSSKQGDFHPLLLTESYVNLPTHMALQLRIYLTRYLTTKQRVIA